MDLHSEYLGRYTSRLPYIHDKWSMRIILLALESSGGTGFPVTKSFCRILIRCGFSAVVSSTVGPRASRAWAEAQCTGAFYSPSSGLSLCSQCDTVSTLSGESDLGLVLWVQQRDSQCLTLV